MNIIYILADITITDSKGSAELLKKSKLLKKKVFTIYNPISVDFVKQKSKELLSGEENKLFKNWPIFITVGRLASPKGQWHLLRIFKIVKESVPNAKLVILGDGDLRSYLVTLSNELGFKTFVNTNNEVLSEIFDVYFLGSQENPFKYMHNSSIFIFTSIFEGFGNVILEALACEVPIISSDCRFGPREILAPETDFTFETKIPEYCGYGVLMPVLCSKKSKASDSFSSEEIVWGNTVIDLYKNKTIYDKYKEKSNERAKYFDVEFIIPEWKVLLNNPSIL
jgi:glycosyltransferase involved in cell wall biosynthesis